MWWRLSRCGWLGGWVEATAAGDVDGTCREMAAACQGLQASLASEALASLAEDRSLTGGNLGGPLLPPPTAGPRLSVALPRIETLGLR